MVVRHEGIVAKSARMYKDGAPWVQGNRILILLDLAYVISEFHIIRLKYRCFPVTIPVFDNPSQSEPDVNVE